MKPPSKAFELFLGILCLCLPASAGAETPEGPAEIRGRILDAISEGAVEFVLVTLTATDFHTTTDRDGRFSLRNIAPGTYTLRAARVGYEDLVRADLRVEAGAVLDIELRMSRKYFRLQAVTVTPGAYSLMQSSPDTRQTMSREDIESVPQLGEDVFRAVSRLPGLSSGDYAAHFSIRGGRHDETLILLDGLELYEPYHLKDFNEGAISIVDVETIDGVQLMTGGSRPNTVTSAAACSTSRRGLPRRIAGTTALGSAS